MEISETNTSEMKHKVDSFVISHFQTLLIQLYLPKEETRESEILSFL